jgi:hypothetical protein
MRFRSSGYSSMSKNPAIYDEQTGNDQRHSNEFERLQPFTKKDRAKAALFNDLVGSQQE